MPRPLRPTRQLRLVRQLRPLPGVLLVLLLAAGLVGTATPALAHGAATFPGSRQYLCWVDGLTESGEIRPTNPACAAVLDQAGTAPYYNWFGNLHPAADGRTVGFVPDGRLCDGGGGGPYDFQPYTAARDDWPRTHLTAGTTITMRHNDWAPHPGRFDVWLTRQGWDPTVPLGWDDLELVHTAVDPARVPGDDGLGDYVFDVALPADRSGDHIVFTHWVRSDSPENFYSCADVAFDGGAGGVSGISGDPAAPPSPSSPADPAPSDPADPSDPSDPADPGGPAAPPQGRGGCTVDYRVVDQWEGGFHAEVAIHNHGTSPIDGWTLSWRWDDGQRLTQWWNARLGQEGGAVRAQPEGWTATIPAGGQVSFGFLGEWAGANPDPAGVLLDGSPCDGPAARKSYGRRPAPARKVVAHVNVCLLPTAVGA